MFLSAVRHRSGSNIHRVEVFSRPMQADKNKARPRNAKQGGRFESHDAVSVVDDLLAQAAEAKASDMHLEPTAKGLLIKFRLDGVLKTVETLPAVVAENVIARLKVLAGLLTYRSDFPQ